MATEISQLDLQIEKKIKEELKKTEADIRCEWVLGFKKLFRGQHSITEFGIITKSGELVLEKIPMKLVEHIIEVHNKSLKENKG